jgi:hypothetical protein
MKEKIFLPMRDYFYQSSETNWVYPAIIGIPVEIIEQI